jgi:hypothetical protein
LHNKSFLSLLSFKYKWNDKFKVDETVRICSTHREELECNRNLVGEPEGKAPVGRLRRRMEDNKIIEVREIGWSGMDWINLA